MQLNKGDNTVASIPTPDSGGTAGYFKNQGSGPPWTVIKADFLNGIAAEFKNVIEAAGLTLSGADLTQLLQAIGGALGVKADATSLTDVTTVRPSVVIGSTTSSASGGTVAASVDGVASGSLSFVGACNDGVASGTRSACIAATGSEASGDESVVIGSASGTASGDYSAVAGSSGSIASGDGSAAVASFDSEASGTGSAVVATEECTTSGALSAALASESSTASGLRSAVVSSSSAHASGDVSAVIGGVNVEVGTDGTIGGGDNSAAGAITPNGTDQGLKWKVTKEGSAHLTLKSGATQVAAGAAVGELWRTATHASLPDGVVMIGI